MKVVKCSFFFSVPSCLLALIMLSPLGCTHSDHVDPTAKILQKNQDRIYRCPMHPQVQSEFAGECLICHMKLQKVAGVSEKKIKYYRNPMDPSVHADNPTKDSMGMDYLPVYEAEMSEAKGSEISKELGRGTFALSPDQLKLSGAQVIVVSLRDLVAEIRVPGRVIGGSRVSFQAFEQDSAFIKVGMNFEGEAPSSPGHRFAGKITSVDSILDPMTRTLRIDGMLAGASIGALKSEASIIGTLGSTFSQVLAVPEEAILHAGSRDLVYVLDNQGVFSPRVVKLGIKSKTYYEVKSGLLAGDKISAGPNFLLDSESKIEFNP
ncbi:MAG: efflux RND transporter periplasmic adaptor subunit [Bdellovibrionales bacterium]|nr:efflux RND transporter periplasmic adaptor subunit [Oligoflexia bacterium]